ncbi:MAG: hypothetical protein HQ518_00805 [Rhodopirellula sp.]|nr:hypothetical protein [Rhodopirellula sp.]
MAWEKRERGSRYFYVCKTLPDGRRVKKYLGHGFEAQIAAARIEDRKLTRLAARNTLRQLRSLTREEDELLDAYCGRVEILVAAEFLSAGFHNPKGRGWRISMKSQLIESETKTQKRSKRGSQKRSSGRAKGNTKPVRREAGRSTGKTTVPSRRLTVAQPVGPQQKVVNETSPDDIETVTAGSPAVEVAEMTLSELVAAAKQGDATVMPRLRKIMWQGREHYGDLGDLASHAKLRWVNLIAGRDLHKRECLLINLRTLVDQFLRDGCSPCEKMLVDEIIITWLPHQHSLAKQTEAAAISIDVFGYWCQRIEQTQRRHLKAIAALRNYRVAMSRIPGCRIDDASRVSAATESTLSPASEEQLMSE